MSPPPLTENAMYIVVFEEGYCGLAYAHGNTSSAHIFYVGKEGNTWNKFMMEHPDPLNSSVQPGPVPVVLLVMGVVQPHDELVLEDVMLLHGDIRTSRPPPSLSAYEGSLVYAERLLRRCLAEELGKEFNAEAWDKFRNDLQSALTWQRRAGNAGNGRSLLTWSTAFL